MQQGVGAQHVSYGPRARHQWWILYRRARRLDVCIFLLGDVQNETRSQQPDSRLAVWSCCSAQDSWDSSSVTRHLARLSTLRRDAFLPEPEVQKIMPRGIVSQVIYLLTTYCRKIMAFYGILICNCARQIIHPIHMAVIFSTPSCDFDAGNHLKTQQNQQTKGTVGYISWAHST